MKHTCTGISTSLTFSRHSFIPVLFLKSLIDVRGLSISPICNLCFWYICVFFRIFIFIFYQLCFNWYQALYVYMLPALTSAHFSLCTVLFGGSFSDISLLIQSDISDLNITLIMHLLCSWYDFITKRNNHIYCHWRSILVLIIFSLCFHILTIIIFMSKTAKNVKKLKERHTTSDITFNTKLRPYVEEEDVWITCLRAGACRPNKPALLQRI